MKVKVSKAALAGLVLTGYALSSSAASTNSHGGTKAEGDIQCKGVSTKWVNDCAANSHKCGMSATTNFDPKEWIHLSAADCTAVKEALKNPAVKKYVERVQTGTVSAAKRGKKF